MLVSPRRLVANMFLLLDFAIVLWEEFFTLISIPFLTRLQFLDENMWSSPRRRSCGCYRFLSVVKPIFICVDWLRNKTCVTATPVVDNYIKGLCIHLKSQCGVPVTQLELFPYGFEANKVTVTMHLDRYVQISFARIDAFELDEIWFQQDGATAHISRAWMAVLKETLPRPHHWITGDLECPTCSPDLVTFWSFHEVFRNHVFMCTIQYPVEIWRPKNSPAVLARVVINYRNQFTRVREWRRHLSDLIFKTM